MLVQVAQHVADVFGVVHQHALGELELDQLAADAVGRGLGDQQGQQAGVDEVRRGEVERDAHLGQALVEPLAQLATGAPDHPLAERHDQAGLFRERHEACRRQQAEVGVLPADERLRTTDMAAVVVLGLIIQGQPGARVVGERAPQVALELHA